MISAALAWTGVVASMQLVIVLPHRLGGAVSDAIVQLAWRPMLAFEAPFGLRLMFKGVARIECPRGT